MTQEILLKFSSNILTLGITMNEQQNYSNFLDVINHLRTEEEILIHSSSFKESEEADRDITLYLEQAYNNEVLNYPDDPPAYHEAAALWGAKTVYIASNLLLNRNDLPENLPTLIRPFEGENTEGAILSIDLCLRFLPEIVSQAKKIDPEDPMIEILESQLKTWHYSAIGYFDDLTGISFDKILIDNCLSKLYLDRIIMNKARQYMENIKIAERIYGILGNHQKHFWPEL